MLKPLNVSTVRASWVLTLAILAFLAGAADAFADDCGALGGALVSGECRITSAVSRFGSFTLDETLRVMGNGRINVPGDASLTLNITGSLIVEVPTVAARARISGDVSGSTATGATITVNATDDIRLEGNGSTGGRISATHTSTSCSTGSAGNLFLTAGGSVVTERNTVLSVNGKCPAGTIEIEAPGIEIGGQVLSESTIGGSGAQRPGGGPITINAGCTLLVQPTAIVRSKGSDPGADLVHLQGGCDVTIYGLVASTGQGHVAPTNPPNHCAGLTRPGKPSLSSGCLEIWSGDTITIDSIGTRKGEVHADISQPGGRVGLAWLDIFARGDIRLLGEATGAFAVHANGAIAGAIGGTISIKSAEGKFQSFRRSVQANATATGGRGGTIDIEADTDIDLADSRIQAQGATSGAGHAGGLLDIKAFNGGINFLVGGQLRTTGGPLLGLIKLLACSSINFGGQSFPPSGNTTGVGCGSHPDIPAFVSIPSCACGPLEPGPRLTVVKEGNGVITSGDVASFTITVTNQGPGQALNVTITDPLPAGLVWTDNKTECDVTGGTTLSCTLPSLAEAASFSVTVTATTNNQVCGKLINTATIAADNENPDSLGDNTDSDVIGVNCPDLSITKVGNGTISAGGVAQFTIQVTNNGPGTATGVTINDTLPAGLVWTDDQANCTITSNVNLSCNVGTLVQSGTFTVIVSATTSNANCGPLQNTATVAGTNEDPIGGGGEGGNNEATDTVTVSCPDVKVEKSGNGTVTAGGVTSFTMVVTNLGPGTAAGVVLTDTLPAGLVWTDDQANCTITSNVNLSCTIGSLANAATFSVTVQATTAAANCGNLPNTAIVGADNESPTAQANNSSTATNVVQCPDVKVEKSGNGTVTAGSLTTFTMVVTNLGPGTATDVTLTDTLPAGLVWTDNQANCTITSNVNLSCTIGSLAEAATFSVTVQATTTNANCGNLPNTANVSATNEASTTLTNNTSSATNAVQCPDVKVEKTGNGTITAGSTASFTITVTNLGPGAATDVTLSDTLPAGLTWTESQPLCTISSGNSLSCTFGTLADGASASVTVTATTTTANCGELPNTATVSATNERPGVSANNTSSATITVTCFVPPDCPTCNGQTLTVDVDTTVNFNTTPPTCTGDADLCNAGVFSYEQVGTEPGNWLAKFDVGAKKLVVNAGVTITTSKVPATSNNRSAPGIYIRSTCEAEINGHILVESQNRLAGPIIVFVDGNIVLNGTIIDRVTGTNGLPGDITLKSCCGDITTNVGSLIETQGVDPGASDINIITCCGETGDIRIAGLVYAHGHAHVPGNPLPDIRILSSTGGVTIDSGTNPQRDEFNINGGLHDLFAGVLSMVESADNPGSVSIQALKDIVVIGHGNDPSAPVRTSYGAVAAGTLTSNGTGGKVDVRSIDGRIIGSDRAFHSFGRYHTAAESLIRLWAKGDILLTRPGATTDFNPVVDSAGFASGGSGGKNWLTSYGSLQIFSPGLVTATGAVPGTNILESTGPATITGTVSPAAAVIPVASGTPDFLWESCEDDVFPVLPGCACFDPE